MKRGIAFLVLWFVVAVVLGSACVSAIPPGGVVWPYYLFVASVPCGAFLYARYDRRVSVVICYGLVSGYLFAWPVFGNDRTMVLGLAPLEPVVLRIGLF